MGAFEYRQAEEIRDAFARHGVQYLFIGKSGAILTALDVEPVKISPPSRPAAPQTTPAAA